MAPPVLAAPTAKVWKLFAKRWQTTATQPAPKSVGGASIHEQPPIWLAQPALSVWSRSCRHLAYAASMHCTSLPPPTCPGPGPRAPFLKPLSGLGTVDVRDVAAAHTLALFTPGAKGRYICSAHDGEVSDIVEALHQLYPAQIGRPGYAPPKWLMWLLGPVFGVPKDVVT